MTTATTLAQDLFESMKNVRYTDLQEGSDSVGEFTRTWSVTQTNQYKRLNAEVSWTRPGGELSRVALRTLVADPLAGSISLPAMPGPSAGAGGESEGSGEPTQ
jgi:hypothetical protein